MSLTSSTKVQADKSQRYVESLAKHFARKVTVTEADGRFTVSFAMGCCVMHAEGVDMLFECTADTEGELEVVKNVIASHIVKYGELKETVVEWQ